MNNLLFDLKKPEYSYMIGFIQADGHLRKHSRNRGKMSIEISYRDKDIIEKLQKIIPVNSTIYTRIRKTNFSASWTGQSLNVFNYEFRKTINYYGVPYGKKSDIIEPPKHEYSEVDYWRGIIDADGSIGYTSKNIPYVSVVTTSEKIYNGYKLFLLNNFNIRIDLKRNKRDNVYNIMINREKAQMLVKILYYKNCLSLNRKYNKAIEIQKWIRTMPIKEKQPKWNKEEIKFLKNNSIQNCLKKLNRTENAIRVKKQRINYEKTN